MGKTRPVIYVMSTLAALQVLTGGAALGDVIGIKAAGLAILAVAALQTGVQFYVQNAVVPVKDVAAYKDKDGELVSGPAAPPADEPVAVVNESEQGAVQAAEPLYEAADGPDVADLR